MNIILSKRRKFVFGHDDILYGMMLLQNHTSNELRNIKNNPKYTLNIKNENFYRWEYKWKPFLKKVLVEYKFENNKWFKIREL